MVGGFWKVRLGLAALAAYLLLAALPAEAAKRVALIIGNDTYKTLPDLNNARKDASDMAAKLKGLGFEVILKTNAGRRQFGRALAEFEGRLAGAEAGLVFYAGHGIQADGKNYLVPSDARIEVEEDLRFEGIDSTEFLKSMKNAGAPVNVVIIDACRDNPLPRRSRSAARGLAVVEVPRGVKGVALLYSAGPGETAADGDEGSNGVFTGALLKALTSPGLTVEQVFKETAKRVNRLTNGKQTPWINASLTGDFYFKRSARTAAPTQSPVPSGGGNMEAMFWSSVQNSADPASFSAYLKKFPNGTFADLARLKAEKLKGQQVASLTPPTQSIKQLDETYVVIKTANVRAKPDAKSGKVMTLGIDTGVQVTGRTADGKWLRIAHGGRDAFIWGSLVKSIDAGELSAWGKIKDSRVKSVIEGFLSDYPSGHYSGRAAHLVAALTPLPKAAVPTQQPSPSVQPAVGVYLQPGKRFRDCADCPEMVVVPAGSFRMGDLSGGGDSDEKPVHQVTIPRAFAVGKYEVTRGAYALFARATGRSSGDGCYVYDGKKWNKESSKGWQNPGYSQTERDPVSCVNWDDAKAYVSWLSDKTGKQYRLLSESEWEYAARSRSATKYSFGDSESSLCRHGNGADSSTGFKWKNASCNDGYGEKTAPVGSFEANGFGLHDMHGNVWEWTEDCWNENYNGAPDDGEARTTGSCTERVLRGGSWYSEPGFLRAAYRYGFFTSFRNYSEFGFRIARTL